MTVDSRGSRTSGVDFSQTGMGNGRICLNLLSGLDGGSLARFGGSFNFNLGSKGAGVGRGSLLDLSVCSLLVSARKENRFETYRLSGARLR